MKQKHVAGSTYCFETEISTIPFYKISEAEIILLDSGLALERQGLQKMLDQYGYQVKGILCSHAHIDHVGNNMHFKDKYGAVIAMTDAEADICKSLDSLMQFYNVMSRKAAEKYYRDMVSDTDIRIYKDQDSVIVAGVRFDILHTPGHSSGHICIVTPDGVAYLGDALTSHEVMSTAKLPFVHLLEDDLASKKKLKTLDCDCYVLAHRGVLENISGLVDENIAFYGAKGQKLLEEIDRPMSIMDLMEVLLDKWGVNVDFLGKYIMVERILRNYLASLQEMDEIKPILEGGIMKFVRIDHE